MIYFEVNNKTFFEGEEILKVYNYSDALYDVKYVKDGHVLIVSYWLKDLNVKSATIRDGKEFYIMKAGETRSICQSSYPQIIAMVNYLEILTYMNLKTKYEFPMNMMFFQKVNLFHSMTKKNVIIMLTMIRLIIMYYSEIS